MWQETLLIKKERGLGNHVRHMVSLYQVSTPVTSYNVLHKESSFLRVYFAAGMLALKPTKRRPALQRITAMFAWCEEKEFVDTKTIK